MTTQPLLRIYREPSPAPATATDECKRQCSESKAAHLIAAVVFSAVVHLAVLGGVSIAAAMVSSGGGSTLPGVPDHPLHTVFVALVLAQCGLGSIFFARGSWPLYIKAVAAALLVGCLWLLLVGTMETTTQSPIAAGAWAACLVIEALTVWTIVTAIEFTSHYELAATRTQFSVLHLLIGTTLVAVCFGGARVLAAKYGFALAAVPQWDFFGHIQVAAIVNAALAVGLYLSLRLPHTWKARAMFSAAVLTAVVVAAPLLFLSVFSNNESLTEMRWLFGSEGLFLIATLVPMEMLRLGGRNSC